MAVRVFGKCGIFVEKLHAVEAVHLFDFSDQHFFQIVFHAILLPNGNSRIVSAVSAGINKRSIGS